MRNIRFSKLRHCRSVSPPVTGHMLLRFYCENVVWGKMAGVLSVWGLKLFLLWLCCYLVSLSSVSGLWRRPTGALLAFFVSPVQGYEQNVICDASGWAWFTPPHPQAATHFPMRPTQTSPWACSKPPLCNASTHWHVPPCKRLPSMLRQ